jgi:enoyl-[acyl-carrier-protein] reductase (NADH)
VVECLGGGGPHIGVLGEQLPQKVDRVFRQLSLQTAKIDGLVHNLLEDLRGSFSGTSRRQLLLATPFWSADFSRLSKLVKSGEVTSLLEGKAAI